MRRILFSLLCTALAVLAKPSNKKSDFPEELLIVESAEPDVVHRFTEKHLVPRHAVALASVADGSKRHKVLKELASDELLKQLIAIGAVLNQGIDMLHVYHYGYHEPVVYKAYPLVNRMHQQFAPVKFITGNPFGILLVMRAPDEQTDELVETLNEHATKMKDRIKVTFFYKNEQTKDICKLLNILSNDEMLLIEKPQEFGQERIRGHSHFPRSPSYRMEGVSVKNINNFFERYHQGKLRPYLPSKLSYSQHLKLETSYKSGDIRVLTGWNFLDTVLDPERAVLVEFVSPQCDACQEFDAAYREVARKAHEFPKSSTNLSHVIVARIDQSDNDHTEVIKGTPWLKYWPRGQNKRALDVELRSVESILEFLEDKAMAESTSQEEEIEKKHTKDKKRKTSKKVPRPVQSKQKRSSKEPRLDKSAVASEL